MRKRTSILILICVMAMMIFASANIFAAEPFEGSGTEKDPYLITNYEDLCKLAELVNAGKDYYNTAHYLQTEDIIVNEGSFTQSEYGMILWNNEELSTSNHPEQWEGIAQTTSTSPQTFCGTYDGGGHSISGLYSTNENGLLGSIKNAEIRKLTLTNSFFTDNALCHTANNSIISYCTIDVFVRKTISGYYSSAGFINTIENCTVSYCTNNNLVRSNNGNAGGFFLDANNSTISNCINNGNIEGGTIAAGITVSAKTTIIKNCTNNGIVNGELNNTAGICGIATTIDISNPLEKMSITNCVNNGTIRSSYGAGGICGTLDSNIGEILYCTNNGTVGNVSGSYGGIVYKTQGTVLGCVNLGTVGGGGGAGGIAMVIEKGTDPFATKGNTLITQCANKGNVTAKHTVGGICGTTNNSGAITYCYNTGNVSATNTDIAFTEKTFAGGIIGTTFWGEKAISISNCYNTGNVTAVKYGGGIAGHSQIDSYPHCFYLQGTAATFSGLDSTLNGYNKAPSSETEMKTPHFVATLNENGKKYKYDDLKENNGYPELLILSQMPFTDVPTNAYFFNDVHWALEKGITYGMGDGTFGSDQNCTRAQFITFLWRAAEEPKATITQTPFTDCDVNQYYYPALLWAYENDLVAGMTETTFEPDGKITRAQVVTFLWRDSGSEIIKTTSPFTDVPSDAWYADAVTWAYSTKLASGMTETTFDPDIFSTRAHVVAFLHRYAEAETK